MSQEFFTDRENKEKRFKLIRSYHEHVSKSSSKSSLLAEYVQDLGDEENLEQGFTRYLLSSTPAQLDSDEVLVETFIRYSMIYLEDFAYDLKLTGLSLIEHLITNITPSKLLVNMRSNLIYECLSKYVTDKDSCVFLERVLPIMALFLNQIETRHNAGEHCYVKHSEVVGSILSICYMTTDPIVKTIFLRHLATFVDQMGEYSSRHLEKYLTVGFDFVDSVKSLDLEYDENQMRVRQELAECSIDLVSCLIKNCESRMHVHARRIVNFCIKILYNYSVNSSDDNDFKARVRDNVLLGRLAGLVKELMRIERVKSLLDSEMQQVANFNQRAKCLVSCFE